MQGRLSGASRLTLGVSLSGEFLVKLLMIGQIEILKRGNPTRYLIGELAPFPAGSPHYSSADTGALGRILQRYPQLEIVIVQPLVDLATHAPTFGVDFDPKSPSKLRTQCAGEPVRNLFG
jgi:hypothetical protein